MMQTVNFNRQNAVESSRNILAFSHIGKTGGTTLIHVLRKNFFLRYCDVIPLSASSGKLLTVDDLQKFIRANPFVRCVSGHSIRPYGALKLGFPNLQYITLLRDPIARCISQYQQRVKKHGKIDFEDFLNKSWLPNLQTRFVAGCEDLEKAKEVLNRDFLLVGTLDKFDEFVAMLADRLNQPNFDPTYAIRRVEKNREAKKNLLEKYKKDIELKHELDIELYRYVTDFLFPKALKLRGPIYYDMLQKIEAGKKIVDNGYDPKAYADYLVRKAYYEPLFSAIKKLRALTVK